MPLLAAAAASLALAAAPPVDIAATRDYAAQRPGTVAFAVRSESGLAGVRAEGARPDRVFPSASVLRPMLLVAYARHAGARRFSARERALLNPMIRRSDNAA